MTMNGIQDLIPFLLFLRKRRIHFELASCRDDAVMVTITLVGARVEIDFFDDHIEFSTFSGDEAVEDEPEALLKVIDQHWDP